MNQQVSRRSLRRILGRAAGRQRGQLRALSLIVVLVLLCMPLVPLVQVAVAQEEAATSSFRLVVREYRTDGTIVPIANFNYIVNLDETGDPSSPDPFQHPALKATPSYSPIVANGNQTQTNLRLNNGRYLVSVRADGYKVGGKHFRLPGTATVVVELVKWEYNGQPGLPLAAINIIAFEDNHPLNGAPDQPDEAPLAGFRVFLDDGYGEVTVDYFNRPLCGGACYTGADGTLTIHDLAPGKYGVTVVPPDGSGWVQTSTIEGKFAQDAWIEEGNTGFLAEEGLPLPMAWFGFIKPTNFAVPGTGTITGRARNGILWVPPVNPEVLYEGLDRPWLALVDLNAGDQTTWVGRGNADGSFTIPNVPSSLYQLVIWDEPLDYIISFFTVDLTAGGSAALGDLGIPRWFGKIHGDVYTDVNGNGLRDPGEPGVPEYAMDTRFRDGSIEMATATDHDGHYVFDEVFPYGWFNVAEVGYTRFKRLTANVYDIYDTSVVTFSSPGALLLNEIIPAGYDVHIDYGRQDFEPTENGGIVGIVYYATMINEYDARLQAAEDYEPGVPDVTVRLLGLGADGKPNTADDVLLNQVKTDHWQHPTNCDALDQFGNPIPGIPSYIADRCTETLLLGTDVKDGVFDGGYAFESYWSPAYGAPGAVEVDGLPPGDYVVQVVVPPHYQIVKEEDQNNDQGQPFVEPAIPPPPCVGNLHLVNDPRNPYYNGQQVPLCDKRLVTLQPEQSSNCDFFIHTANKVPEPGYLIGLLTDDLNLETNPNKIWYGEKIGIPNIPMGIRDFTGRLITTVSTDENGIFEVMLPASDLNNIPIPSGHSPSMYRVTGNDPGEPGHPNANFNPLYQTLTLIYDIWPGKQTLADVAIIPISPINVTCNVPSTEPQVVSVSTPVVTGSGALTISGFGFGAQGTASQVSLNGLPLTVTSWNNTSIHATIPAGFTPGAHQLLVRASNGKTSTTGMTIHVLGTGYSPPVVNVSPGTVHAIQNAINGAAPDSLILVHPGVYNESLILSKNVKLQGYGSGNTTIDSRFFDSYINDWKAQLAALGFPPETPGAAGVTVIGTAGTFTGAFNTQIDGFTIANARGNALVPQLNLVGSGIHVLQWGQNLEISNNHVLANAGNVGGGIVIGELALGDATKTDNNNDGIQIHNNRITGNGGVSRAGGVAIFNGAENYDISHNDVCGNYSGEYGAGISHFGNSNGAQIHNNRIYYNESFDEAGGVMVSAERLTLEQASAVAGVVDVYDNLIQANLANDDGGGIRVLMAGTTTVTIQNNLIVNNVSTHLGGGIALDDISNPVIVNNTIVNNVTTSTAEDADGLPHAAGLGSEVYSSAFRQYAGNTPPFFSNAALFNNIFWNNQAYGWDGVNFQLTGPTNIDFEVLGGAPTDFFQPISCTLSVPYPPPPGTMDPSNTVVDPRVRSPYLTTVGTTPFAGGAAFVTLVINRPPVVQGDYHVQLVSPAIDKGAEFIDFAFGATTEGAGLPMQHVLAPLTDIDLDARPGGAAWDIGADETPVGSPRAFLPLLLNASILTGTVPLANQEVSAPAADTPAEAIEQPPADAIDVPPEEAAPIDEAPPVDAGAPVEQPVVEPPAEEATVEAPPADQAPAEAAPADAPPADTQPPAEVPPDPAEVTP